MAQQQTPAPMPGRSYYGFVLYILGWTGIVCYLTWALVPHCYLNQLGISYLPQRYWAVAIPSLVIAGVVVFITLVYPGLNMMLAVPPHDIRNLEDSSTIRQEAYDDRDFFLPRMADVAAKEPSDAAAASAADSTRRLECNSSKFQLERKKSDVEAETGAENSTVSYDEASVPPVYDLHISDVCRILYSTDSQ